MEHRHEIRKIPLKTALFTGIVTVLAVLSQVAAETDGAPVLPVAANERLYAIDTAASIIYIHVRRGGLLARAGHDHIVSSEAVEGSVNTVAELAGSRAELRIPLAQLIVDDPEHRTRFGLEAGVSESSILGTSGNMQEKVLDADHHPWAEVSAVVSTSTSTNTVLDVTISLHGSTYEYVVPVDLEIDDQRLAVSGKMSIAQTHFGIRPFRAAAGMLRVADRLDIEFDIVARVQDGADKVD